MGEEPSGADADYVLERLPFYGPSAKFDPVFSYYRGRCAESIASEIRAAGYRAVRFVLTSESDVDPALLHELYRHGIGVWFATFCNGVFCRKDLPPDSAVWRMLTRNTLEGKPQPIEGFQLLCMNHPDYRAWKKRELGSLLKRELGSLLKGQLFQGVDLIEPYWPDYPGPKADGHGCFCSCCERVFRQMFPDESQLPDILDSNGPYGPKGNPALWKKWQQFRIATVTDFLEDLARGPDGIRQAAPETKICLWTRTQTEQHRREHPLPPNADYLPVSWPDWMHHNLPPVYPARQGPFFDTARNAPEPFRYAGVNTVSEALAQHGGAWIRADASTCAVLRVSSTTPYDYRMGDDLYRVPPVIVRAVPRGTGIDLHFSKCLAPDTARKIERFQTDTGHIVSLDVEGEIVHLALTNIPQGALVTITASQISDDSDAYRFPTLPPATLITQSIEVPF